MNIKEMNIKNNKNKTNSIILAKKLNNEHKVIPLNTIDNTFNETKHFPPTVREWYNSIYTYKNSLINSSILNRDLNTLIKGYFYMYYNRNILRVKNKSIRLKRLSLKRIFISKMELKHTNTKIVITMYVYNEEKRILLKKFLNLIDLLFYVNKRKSERDISSKPLINLLNLINKQENHISLINYLNLIRNIFILRLKIIQDNLLYTYDTNYYNKNKDTINTYVHNLLHNLYLLNNVIINCKSNKELYDKYNNIYREMVRNIYLEKEIKLLNYYKLLLILNKNKFKDYFLSKLSLLTSKIFNKQVEFNIVNQKSVQLNSDFFTEAILIKLRKRENRVLRVLKKFFRTLKVWKVNKIERNINYFNTPSIKKINAINYNKDKDLLNNLLLDSLSLKSSTINKNKKKKINDNIENLLVNSLKYKNVVGIRLEAKGRLSRRFTASRSVFKVKWKGSTRNIDSSYKGLSSVMLRGHLKSNIQYSLANSTTRNGAFGLKGWMSGN